MMLDALVMGSDHEAGIGGCRELQQQLHHGFTCFVIQRGGRFVTNNDLGTIDGSTGNCHTLLLPLTICSVW